MALIKLPEGHAFYYHHLHSLSVVKRNDAATVALYMCKNLRIAPKMILYGTTGRILNNKKKKHRQVLDF